MQVLFLVKLKLGSDWKTEIEKEKEYQFLCMIPLQKWFFFSVW